MKINRQKNSRARKKVLMITTVLVSVLVCYGLVAYINRWFPFANVVSDTYEPGTHFINMDKTDNEKRSSDNLKENPQDKIKNPQTDTAGSVPTDPTTGKQQVNVLITNAGVSNGTVSASGFVTNIIESDGSCVYTFTSGSVVLTKTAAVLPNANSTTCSTVSFPSSELKSGTWSVVLSYSSSASTGVSDTREFQK